MASTREETARGLSPTGEAGKSDCTQSLDGVVGAAGGGEVAQAEQGATGAARGQVFLPTEIWAHILSFLASYEVFPVALVCKLFCELLRFQRTLRGEEVWTTWADIVLGSPTLLQWSKGLGRPPVCTQMMGGIKGSEPGQFKYPTRIALHGDEIFVTDWSNNRVQVLHRDTGAPLRVLGTGEEGTRKGAADHPFGIAIAHTRGEVYVSEELNCRVSVFHLSGEFLRKIGWEGRRKGELNRPYGICLSPDETELYVCDSGNYRVKVFAAIDGGILRAWGLKGKGEGQMRGIKDVCVSADGTEVFVSEERNCRVSVFTPMGRFLRVLGRKGEGDGEFNLPTALALTGRGTLLVRDCGSRVQEVRCSDGTFVRKWGGNTIHGIAVGPEGEMYVCNPAKHCIQVLE